MTWLGLINLHAYAWFWPTGVDRQEASVVLSLVMCGVGVLFMVTYMNVGLPNSISPAMAGQSAVTFRVPVQRHGTVCAGPAGLDERARGVGVSQ
ncbi:hypothetical protein [Streptomyces sp. NPDC056464]|uniref:hypothetical protein n=1 Tax=Streptomyces sp. NPDC056464 TaxID=3345828 RepID=UPI00368035C6